MYIFITLTLIDNIEYYDDHSDEFMKMMQIVNVINKL